MKLAETKDEWSRLAASMVPSFRRFPDFISNGLFSVAPLVPEGCMEVWEGEDARSGGPFRRMWREGESGPVKMSRCS